MTFIISTACADVEGFFSEDGHTLVFSEVHGDAEVFLIFFSEDGNMRGSVLKGAFFRRLVSKGCLESFFFQRAVSEVCLKGMSRYVQATSGRQPVVRPVLYFTPLSFITGFELRQLDRFRRVCAMEKGFARSGRVFLMIT